jgi:TRAP-type mannitol/chloroaromatic compound transport system permease small subunit
MYILKPQNFHGVSLTQNTLERYNMYHLIFISIFVYMVVNLFENVFYYSIGRHSNQEGIQIELPTRNDWTKIIFVTFIFAILQGYLTCLFN